MSAWQRIGALSLGQQVIAALLVGAAMLIGEIRVEHREVLGETWHAWVPLAYLTLLLIVGGVALFRFQHGGRRILLVLFALALVVGGSGMWFHSEGHPIRAVDRVATVWLSKPGTDGGIKIGSAPPLLAPGAFVGIGLLGLLACRRRA
jgi:hypothetical protein